MITLSRTSSILCCLFVFSLSAQEATSEAAIGNTQADISFEQTSQESNNEDYRAKQIAAYVMLGGLISTSKILLKLALRQFKVERYGFYTRHTLNMLFPLVAVKLATIKAKQIADIELNDFYLYLCSEVMTPIIEHEIIKGMLHPQIY